VTRQADTVIDLRLSDTRAYQHPGSQASRHSGTGLRFEEGNLF
jgi:hypothetical protein